MTKNELLVPLCVVGLSLAFVAVSIAVALTAGRNRFFVRKKLALGALLLSFSGTAAGCGVVSCYEPMEEPNDTHLTYGGSGGHTLRVDIAEDNEVLGIVYNCEASAFSFIVTNATGHEVQKEDIAAGDGAFDGDYDEGFTIHLDESLAAGSYELRVFPVSSDQIYDVSNQWVALYELDIVQD